MSNTIPNPVAPEVEAIEVEKELPETVAAVEPTEEKQVAQKKKGGFLPRLFALLFLAICAAAYFLKLESVSLFEQVQDLFASNNTLFGVLPALADTTTAAGQSATLALYAFLLSTVITVVFGLIAVISTKGLKVAATAFSLGFAIYAFNVYAVSQTLNLVCLGGAAFGIITYLVLAARKEDNRFGLAFVQCLLSFIVFFAVAFGATKFYSDFAAGAAKLGVEAELLFLVVTTALTFTFMLAYIAMMTKRRIAWGLVRNLLQFVVAALALVVAIMSSASEMLFLITAVVAVVLSLVQVIINWSILAKAKKALKGEEEEQAQVVEEEVIEEAEEATFIREEYAEALPYEGGPVEGVEIAQEVNPTFIPQPAEVKTAGYDFYNCKSFDPFIAMLNEKERNDFTELFILKFKGVMPEIPDYVVGGDNKAFFQKLFIYLGQYRDRIPSDLLAKMYQFAIKLN